MNLIAQIISLLDPCRMNNSSIKIDECCLRCNQLQGQMPFKNLDLENEITIIFTYSFFILVLMIDIDQDKKLAKFQKFQAHIQKDVLKKNKPKMWEEIDDLQKQQRQVLCSDDQLSPESKRKRIKKIKPDKKQFKQKIVREYKIALQKHRSEVRTFRSAFSPQILNMDIPATIKALEQAKEKDKDIPLALKKVGIKSLKTLYIGGAKKQFELVISFLRTGQVPGWIYECHQELMNKKKGDFKGTVKSCLRP